MRLALLTVLLTGPVAIAAPAKKRAPAPSPTTTDAEAPETTGGLALSPQGPHGEGEYGGVKPGVLPRADHGKRPRRPAAKGTLTWIGFEAKDGGADVFLQSVAAFEVSQHLEGTTLIVDLGGLDKLGQNTWRDVDTRFFETPLARITARRVGAARGAHPHPSEVEVRVTFKNPKDAQPAQLRAASEADGMYYQYLTFAGTGTTAVPAATSK
jgi:hypothetical protein